MLEQMMQNQKEFQKLFFSPDSMTHAERITWTKEFVLCAHQELAEILNELDWKSYHTKDRLFDETQIKEEIIDVMRFVMNLCIVWGMTADEIASLYEIKRQKTNNRIKPNANI